MLIGVGQTVGLAQGGTLVAEGQSDGQVAEQNDAQGQVEGGDHVEEVEPGGEEEVEAVLLGKIGGWT